VNEGLPIHQQRTLPRLVAYRIVKGSSPEELERNVNFFLSQPENDYFACIGAPEMWGHYEFVQALHGYK
jgi:hypothetical protein